MPNINPTLTPVDTVESYQAGQALTPQDPLSKILARFQVQSSANPAVYAAVSAAISGFGFLQNEFDSISSSTNGSLAPLIAIEYQAIREAGCT